MSGVLADVEALVATVVIGKVDIGGAMPVRARKVVLRASSLLNSVEASGGVVVLLLPERATWHRETIDCCLEVNVDQRYLTLKLCDPRSNV